tara:strand:- start:50558 stop:51169 length:612 start_codon:yes stop_codon:yes gene_type:complete
MIEYYKEIKSPTVSQYKEKKSKFIAYIFSVYNETDIKEKLKLIRKKESSANHYCYAYIINLDKSKQISNDDGEPSSSAGKPILSQIIANDLTNTLIVVARHYGGIKLGIPGLIRSYKTAAANVIMNASINIIKITEDYKIIFNYLEMNNVMRIIKKYNLEIITTKFNNDYELIIRLPLDILKLVKKTLKENHKITMKKIILND